MTPCSPFTLCLLLLEERVKTTNSGRKEHFKNKIPTTFPFFTRLLLLYGDPSRKNKMFPIPLITIFPRSFSSKNSNQNLHNVDYPGSFGVISSLVIFISHILCYKCLIVNPSAKAILSFHIFAFFIPDFCLSTNF